MITKNTTLAETPILVHRYYLPDTATFGDPAPLLLMIHGYGGNEDVMWVFKRVAPPNAAIIAPRGWLTAPDEGGYRWFEHARFPRVYPQQDSLDAALNQLNDFYHALPEYYPVDLDRVAMIGFSQGAVMCNSFATRYPDQLVGVGSMGGSIPEMVPGVDPHPNLLRDLPVFISHGTKDETVTLDFAQFTRDRYLELGAHVTYREYNVGHKMSLDGLRDMRAWLDNLLA